jgi:bacterial/archaeal transporter family protein
MSMALLFVAREVFIGVTVIILLGVALLAFMKFLQSREGRKIIRQPAAKWQQSSTAAERACVKQAQKKLKVNTAMSEWFWYAIAAAVLYGLHQVFTKLASERIGDGLGGFVVELTAALIIAVYLVYLKFFSEWKQPITARGVFYSVLTGLCVGAGTVAFFLLFQKGGPLSAVPMVLAGGAAIMAVVGILLFKEPATLIRVSGIVLSLLGLFLLRYSPGK